MGRVKSLNRGHLLAVESSEKRLSGTYLTFRPSIKVVKELGGPCCAPCSAPCSADIEPSLLGRIPLRPLVSPRLPLPRVPLRVGASSQSIGVGFSAASLALPLPWSTLDTTCYRPYAPPASPNSSSTVGRGPLFSSSLDLK